MVGLINALLNVSRLELGTIAVEPELVNIIQIAKTCIKELKPLILEKKLVLNQKYDKSVTFVRADPKLLTIIFQNLLSNSVKYTKSGGSISLTTNSKNKNLLITLSDTGIGIPRDQQREIYEKLYRADNAKKMDPDGSGLGLYIVKEIVRYTGGKLWFESDEGNGTTFYIRLPLSGMSEKVGGKKLI
jgi:two-component system sensor histidine kinase VicK